MMTISNEAGVALCAVGLILSTIFVFLRLFVRWHYLGIISTSDGFIVLALILYTYLIITDIFTEVMGQWQQRLRSYEQISKAREYYKDDSKILALIVLIWSAGGVYFATLYCVKAAFLFFYYTLFPKVLRGLRIALHFTAALCVVAFFVTEGVILFGCRPLSSTWSLGEDHCEPYTKLGAYYFSISAHLITDFLIYILPFALLSHMELKGRERFGVMAMFFLGFVNICVGTVRAVVIGHAFRQQAAVNTLAAIEICTAIMIACSPPLKWLFRYRGKKLPSAVSPIYHERPISISVAQDLSIQRGDTWLTGDIEVLEWGTYVSKSRRGSDTPRVGRASSTVDPDMEGILVARRTSARRNTATSDVEGAVAKPKPLARIESGHQQDDFDAVLFAAQTKDSAKGIRKDGGVRFERSETTEKDER